VKGPQVQKCREKKSVKTSCDRKVSKGQPGQSRSKLLDQSLGEKSSVRRRAALISSTILQRDLLGDREESGLANGGDRLPKRKEDVTSKKRSRRTGSEVVSRQWAKGSYRKKGTFGGSRGQSSHRGISSRV